MVVGLWSTLGDNKEQAATHVETGMGFITPPDTESTCCVIPLV